MFGFLIGTVLVVLRCYYLIVYLLYIRDVKCSVQSDHVRGFIVNSTKEIMNIEPNSKFSNLVLEVRFVQVII